MRNLLVLALCIVALPVFGQGHIMEAHESNPQSDLLMSQTYNEGGAKDWSENGLVATLIGSLLAYSIC